MVKVQIRSRSSYCTSHQGRAVCGCYMHPFYMAIVQSRGYSPTTTLLISACRVFSICSLCNAKIQEKEAKAERQVVTTGFPSFSQAFFFSPAAQLELRRLAAHQKRLIRYAPLWWHAGRKEHINIQIFRHGKSPLNSLIWHPEITQPKKSPMIISSLRLNFQLDEA